MNILLYGTPAATAAKIATRYNLRMVNSPDKFNASGTLMLVPLICEPRYLLAFYNAMQRHEAEVDAVVICNAESCAAVNTVRYCTPPDKFFTLSGDLDDDGLFDDLCELLDTLSDERNHINF